MSVLSCSHPWEAEVARRSPGHAQGRLPLVAVTQMRRVILARGDALGAGQGRHVKHDITSKVLNMYVLVGPRYDLIPYFGCVCYSIRQDESALGVCVVDLDSLATVHCVDVVRTGSQGAHSILRQAEDTMKSVFEPVLDSHIEGAHDAGCTTAVPLHARHSCFGLNN